MIGNTLLAFNIIDVLSLHGNQYNCGLGISQLYTDEEELELSRSTSFNCFNNFILTLHFSCSVIPSLYQKNYVQKNQYFKGILFTYNKVK